MTAAKDKLEGKKEFEKYTRDREVQIQHYHADNEIFKSKACVLDCQLSRKRITYAGVGAHHQNGVAKQRIRVLQDLTCTQLIHANQRWLAAINAHLWPYALWSACAAWNESPNMKDSAQISPEQDFTKVKMNHTFGKIVPLGCLVYVLAQPMQYGGHQHKWKEISRIGIYLGQSPDHARNVAFYWTEPWASYLHSITSNSIGNLTLCRRKVESTWTLIGS